MAEVDAIEYKIEPQVENVEAAGGASDVDDDEYPEQGPQAWMVVLGAWCIMMPGMGMLNTLAPLQAWLSENQLQGMDESKTGWIYSAYAFFVTAGGAQVGPIFDAHDVRFLTIPGSIGMVASMIFLSVSTEFYQILLSFGVCGGLSASLLFTPALSAIGHWFCKRRAFATGIATTAGGLGGIAWSLIIQYLSPRIGFSWAMRIIAFISAAMLAVANLTLRKRLPPEPKARLLIDFGLLRRPKFAITVCAVFCIESAVFIPYGYISSFALAQGLTYHDAFLLNVVLNAGAIPGRMLPGYVADRVGAFNVMCLTSLSCTVLVLGLWLIAGSDTAKVVSFTALFGFWSGAAISLAPVCVSRVCRIEDYGKSNGMAYFIASFGALMGIPIAGGLLDTERNPYRRLIMFDGGVYAVSFVVFCIARGVAGGWRLGRF